MTAKSYPPPTDDLGYAQLFAILLRRSTWLIGVLAAVLAIAGILTAVEKPKYRSTMQLLVEPNYEQTLQDTDQTFQPSDRQNQVDYATQLNLLRSDQFIAQAIAMLKSDYPDLDIEEVRESLALMQVLEDDIDTKIFEIVYEDSDPIKTQRFVEALNQVYQRYNQEQQKLRLERGLSFINDQLEAVRSGLSDSQASLEEFRRRHNIINPEQQSEAIATALNTVIEQQQETQAQFNQARSRFAALQQQINLSPRSALIASRLTQSNRFQALLSATQETELALAQQQALYTDDAPRVRTLLRQRENNLSLLQAEVSRVLGGEAAVSGGDALTTGLALGQLSEVDISQISALAQVQVELVSLQARSQSLAQADRQLRTDLSRYPSLIAEFDRLQPTVEIEREILAQILEERQDFSADLARGGFNWQLVEAAQPGEKISPSPLRNLALGLVAGLFLGGVVAFMREAMDRVVRSPDLLNQQTGTPLLGILPELAIDSPSSYRPFRRSEISLIEAAQWMPFREALDLIYKNIQLQNPALKSLVITSALPQEGKTTFAFGLALSAARLHQRVLLIDADLRRPTLHDRLRIPSDPGLTAALEGASPHPQKLTISGTAIDVLPAGGKPIDPVKLLSSRRMRDLMAQFGNQYDLVLIDTPPVIGLVDAIEVASCCQGAVLVGRLDRITQTELAQATAALRQLNVLGIVANGSRRYPRPYLEAIDYNNSDRNGRSDHNGHVPSASIPPIRR